MKTYHLLILTAILAFATSCNRLDVTGMIINRSDTEERVAEWLDWNAQHGITTISNVPDNYKVYSTSDCHYAASNGFVTHSIDDRLYQFITAERNDPDAIFSILAGDLANESGEEPYRLVNASMQYNASTQAKDDHCFVIMGNHDAYFDCAQYYKQYFHTSTYPVVVETQSGAKDLFLFLDSSNGTHGKRQMDWLEEQLSHRNEYRNCIVISHCWLFRTSYNYTTTPAANLPEEEQYAFMDLMSRHDVSLVVMGHFHAREQRQFGGITYVMTDNLNEGQLPPSYLIISCGDKIEYEYAEISARL